MMSELYRYQFLRFQKAELLTNLDPGGNSFDWTVIQSLFSKQKSSCMEGENIKNKVGRFANMLLHKLAHKLLLSHFIQPPTLRELRKRRALDKKTC